MATATNNNAVDFGSAGSAWGTVTHLGLWAGTVFIGASALTAPRAVVNGAAVTFPSGDLTIQSVVGEASNAGSRRALSGYMGSAGNLLVSLHTGAPGTAGTDNELTGTGYAREAVAVTDFTISDP